MMACIILRFFSAFGFVVDNLHACPGCWLGFCWWRALQRRCLLWVISIVCLAGWLSGRLLCGKQLAAVAVWLWQTFGPVTKWTIFQHRHSWPAEWQLFVLFTQCRQQRHCSNSAAILWLPATSVANFLRQRIFAAFSFSDLLLIKSGSSSAGLLLAAECV